MEDVNINLGQLLIILSAIAGGIGAITVIWKTCSKLVSKWHTNASQNITVKLEHLSTSIEQIGDHVNDIDKRFAKRLDDINESLDDITKNLEDNSRATVAASRKLLERTYNTYKDKKKMPMSAWKGVEELYSAYTRVTVDHHHPNSWANNLYEEMKEWEKE